MRGQSEAILPGSCCGPPTTEPGANTRAAQKVDLGFLFVWVFASRWWAWMLIKGLSPEEALQVRAKVSSLEALKGQRTDLGLQRAWEGNYLVSKSTSNRFCSV